MEHLGLVSPCLTAALSAVVNAGTGLTGSPPLVCAVPVWVPQHTILSLLIPLFAILSILLS